MKREIKFRAWDGERMIYLSDLSIGLKKSKKISPYAYFSKDTFCNHVKLGKHELMQFTGLKDKNGKDLYELDFLRIRVFMGDNKEYLSDAIYKINTLSYRGLNLSFVRMINDDPKNQYPICQSPSFEYHSLCTDHRNNHLDRIALMNTWGENTLSRIRWQENHYSNDIEYIGNIFENPELLNS